MSACVEVKSYVLFKTIAVRALSDVKHQAKAERFISDKARTASVLNGVEKTTHLMSSLAR